MRQSAKKQPLYDQLVDLLREKIETEMKPDDLLPSERELSSRYGISRTTVRLALAALENAGLIYRRHGKGTYVAKTAQLSTNLTDTYSFTDQMKNLGRVPETRTLSFEIIEANKYLANQMGLSIGDKIVGIKRLRIADDIPMMVEMSYLPRKLLPMLTKADLIAKPLYQIIEDDYHIHIKVAEEEFSASIARFDDARVLEIPEGSAVLRLSRHTYTQQGQIIEFTRSIARADLFRYKVSHYRN